MITTTTLPQLTIRSATSSVFPVDVPKNTAVASIAVEDLAKALLCRVPNGAKIVVKLSTVDARASESAQYVH